MLVKQLSYECRYLNGICTVNLDGFADIAKYTYDNTLILDGSNCSYEQDTFLYLYIRFIVRKFLTGIYNKVDNFKFEVTSHPFSESNVHTHLVYKAFYSQLILSLDFVTAWDF